MTAGRLQRLQFLPGTSVPGIIVDIMNSCFTEMPESRPSFGSLVAHLSTFYDQLQSAETKARFNRRASRSGSQSEFPGTPSVCWPSPGL